jgi:hypothetical protein
VDIVPYLSAVILVATIATILLAVLSYAAFKLRDKRKPKGSDEKPHFFNRYPPEAARELLPRAEEPEA